VGQGGLQKNLWELLVQDFNTPDALAVTQPILSKHWKLITHNYIITQTPYRHCMIMLSSTHATVVVHECVVHVIHIMMMPVFMIHTAVIHQFHSLMFSGYKHVITCQLWNVTHYHIKVHGFNACQQAVLTAHSTDTAPFCLQCAGLCHTMLPCLQSVFSCLLLVCAFH